MALRSSFTRVFGAVIPSAWANSIRDHLVTIATSDDVSVQGQLAVNTATGRVMIHDGSGPLRLANYTEAGRSWVRRQQFGDVFGSGTTGDLGFLTSVSDADGWWFGSPSRFVVPAGFAGVYAITIVVDANVGMSGGGTILAEIAGTTYASHIASNSDTGFLSLVLALAAGDTIRPRFYNGHSGTVTTSQACTIVRMCR